MNDMTLTMMTMIHDVTFLWIEYEVTRHDYGNDECNVSFSYTSGQEHKMEQEMPRHERKGKGWGGTKER